MAFPTTGILDNFNRADGGVGSNYSSYWGNYDLAVSGNTLATSSIADWCGQYYNVRTYGPDCENYITIVSDPLHGIALDVRAGGNLSTSPNSYNIIYDGYNVTIQRVDNGTQTVLGSSFSISSPSVGDSIGLSAVGSTLEFWYKPSGGSWTSQGTRTDTTYTSAGYLAVSLICPLGHSITLDDFGGGTISSVKILTADQASFTLTGQAASLYKYPPLTANTASIKLTTPDASLVINKIIRMRALGTAKTGTTSISTLAQPTGTVTDDILVAFIVDRATTGTTTAPTGWTRQGGAAGTGGRFQIFTAVKDRNGLTGTSWTWSGLTTRALGRIIGYYNANPADPIDVAPSARINASGTMGTTAVTTATANAMVIAGFAALASGSTWSAEAVTSPTLAERADSANSTYLSLAIADGIKAATGTTGASNATMATAGANAGILFAIKKWLRYNMQASFSAISVTGYDAGLTKYTPKILTADQASFTQTGYDADLIKRSPIAFPSTGILDNFNRADASPLDGDWTNGWYSDTPARIVSNLIRTTILSSLGGIKYNSATYGPDAEAYVTITSEDGSNGTNNAIKAICIRVSGSDPTPDGYLFHYKLWNDNSYSGIMRMDEGIQTQLGAKFPLSLVSGDKIGIRTIGTTIKAYTYTSGAWSDIASRTDSVYTEAGYLGLEFGWASAELDDFGGGTMGNYGLTADQASFTLTGQNAGFRIPTLKNDLIHYWRFDAGSGSTVRDITGGNDYTIPTDASWITDGVYGTGVLYDTLCSHVHLPDVGGHEVSLLWVMKQPVAGGQWAGISLGWADYNESFISGAQNANGWGFHVNGSGTNIGYSGGEGVIHVGIATFDNGVNVGYLDNTTPVTLANNVLDINTGNLELAMGSAAWDTDALNREFYVCAMWDRILTSDEISSLMSNPYIEFRSLSLTASQATFSQTNQAANLLTGHRLVASNATFTQTGQDANLLYGKHLDADQATFVQTGQSANFPIARHLDAEQATFVQTGNSSNFLIAHRLTAEYVSFVETWQSSNLLRGNHLDAEQVAFAQTGVSSNLLYGRHLDAEQASFAETGQDVNFPNGKCLSAAQATFAETGNAVNFLIGHRLSAVQAAFVQAGQSAGLLVGHKLTAVQGTFAHTGQDASLLTGHNLSASQVGFTHTGQSVNLLTGHRLTADQATFAQTGNATGFLYGKHLDAVQATFTQTNQAANLLFGKHLDADQVLFVETASSANLLRGFHLDAAQTTFTHTGQSVVLGVAMPAQQAAFAQTNYAANLLQAKHLDAAHGAVSGIGNEVNLLVGKKLTAEFSAFAEAGQDVALLKKLRLSAEHGVFTSTGQSIGFLYGNRLDAQQATFVGTANPANLLVGHRLVASQAAFVQASQDASLLKGRHLDAEQAAFAQTPASSNLLHGRHLDANQTAFAHTGQVTGFSRTRIIGAEQASYAVNGQSSLFPRTRIMGLSHGTFVLNGNAAGLNKTTVGAYVLSAAQLSLTLAAQNANLLAGRRLATGQSAFTHTGQSSNLLFGRKIQSTQVSFTLSGQPSQFTRTRIMGAARGSFALTGNPANLNKTAVNAYALTASQLSLTLSSFASSLLVGRRGIVEQASYSVLGQEIAFRLGMPGDLGSFVLNGQEAQLQRSRIMSAEQAPIILTNYGSELLRGYPLSAETALFDLTGNSTDLRATHALLAASGSYALTGIDASLYNLVLVHYLMTAARTSFTLSLFSSVLRTGEITPFSRRLIIKAENRVYLVLPENRVCAVENENRTYSVVGENRTYAIEPENRKLEVMYEG